MKRSEFQAAFERFQKIHVAAVFGWMALAGFFAVSPSFLPLPWDPWLLQLPLPEKTGLSIAMIVRGLLACGLGYWLLQRLRRRYGVPCPACHRLLLRNCIAYKKIMLSGQCPACGLHLFASDDPLPAGFGTPRPPTRLELQVGILAAAFMPIFLLIVVVGQFLLHLDHAAVTHLATLCLLPYLGFVVCFWFWQSRRQRLRHPAQKTK